MYHVTGTAINPVTGVTVQIDETVTYPQLGMVRVRALEQANKRLDWRAIQWADEPTVTEVPQDQQMRAIGAPTLPGME